MSSTQTAADADDQAGDATPAAQPPAIGPLRTARQLSPDDMASFAETLAALVRARTPLPDALRVLGKEVAHRRFRAALADMQSEIEAGVPLASAMRKHPALFPELFAQIVECGCAANDLNGALLELARECRAHARFRRSLWEQLFWPAATCVVFVGLLLLLVVWDIPAVYADLYSHMRHGWFGGYGRGFPLVSRVLFTVTSWLHHPEYYVPLLVALFGAGLVGLGWGRSRPFFHRFALGVPFLGSYLQSLMLARFCRLTSLLLGRNMGLNVALLVVRDMLSFSPLRQAVEHVADRVASGAALADALAGERAFPPTFTFFIRGAEMHGELAQTLSQLAELYEDRARFQGVRLSLMIYLLAVLSLALCVLFVTLGCLMPFFGAWR